MVTRKLSGGAIRGAPWRRSSGDRLRCATGQGRGAFHARVERRRAGVELLEVIEPFTKARVFDVRLEAHGAAGLRRGFDGGGGVIPRLIPWTCVGPPTTSRSADSNRLR